MAAVAESEFCCEALSEVVAGLPEEATPTMFMTDGKMLMMTVGIVPTDEGLGYMDQAAAFCPFCGTALQKAQTIVEKVGH